MNAKPKYFLKYEQKEVESDSLEELMRLTKNLTVYWEVYRVYRSGMRETKKVLTIKMIEEVKRLSQRGYNAKAIEKQLGITKHLLEKIIGKNAIVEI